MPLSQVALPALEAARLLALAAQADTDEVRREARALTALQHYLGVEADEAGRLARRCILHQRDLLLYEWLCLRLAPAEVGRLLDELAVHGEEQILDRAPRGLILVSLHYGVYSSFLSLWLSRLQQRAHFPELVLLLRGDAQGRSFADRQAELAAAGVIERRGVTLVDLSVEPALPAVRALVRKLRAGAALLILPDAQLKPQAGPESIAVRLGCQSFGFAAGARLLARLSSADVATLHVRAEGTGHGIEIDPPRPSGCFDEALQSLVDRTINRDPVPWDGWLRL